MGTGMFFRCCEPKVFAKLTPANEPGYSQVDALQQEHFRREGQRLDAMMQSLKDEQAAEAARQDRYWMSTLCEPSDGGGHRGHVTAEPAEFQREAANVNGRREGEELDTQLTQDQPEANPKFKRIPLHSNATYNPHPLSIKEYNHEAAWNRLEQLEDYHGGEFEATQQELNTLQQRDAELYLKLRCVLLHV